MKNRKRTATEQVNTREEGELEIVNCTREVITKQVQTTDVEYIQLHFNAWL